MPPLKNGAKSKRLAEALKDASWHVSHAMGLAAFAPKQEVKQQWLQAAAMEEHAALVLEADGRGLEAAVHRISAASCFEEVEEYQRALTLLHAALSVEMRPVYRAKIEKQLKDCLAKARAQLRRRRRKKTVAAS
jgi:hypothetical protein